MAHGVGDVFYFAEVHHEYQQARKSNRPITLLQRLQVNRRIHQSNPKLEHSYLTNSSSQQNYQKRKRLLIKLMVRRTCQSLKNPRIIYIVTPEHLNRQSRRKNRKNDHKQQIIYWQNTP